MAWPKKNPDNPTSSLRSVGSSGSPYEGGNRNSPSVDDGTRTSSSNAPFSGYGAKRSGFKPQYANDGVNLKQSNNARPRLRGARFGQGGFARVFQRKPGSLNLGAASSGPSGNLSGIFGL